MKNEHLIKLLDQLSPEEKKQIESSLVGKKARKPHDHTFSGRHIKFGYYSDPHVGNSEFSEPLWHKMCAYFKREGISVVYCAGDNLEGMSGRGGHIYELSHIGASAQLNYACGLFKTADKLQFFIIDGNHDQWFKQKSDLGFVAGEAIAAQCSNVTFLGEWEADVRLAKGVVMKLYHANDGSA